MPLKLNTASGGSVSIEPTNTASNFVLTVPAQTATLMTNKTAGTVLQVVQATYATEVTNSTSTYADTGLTASITPTSSTSKILVIVNQNGCYKRSNNTYLRLKLFRGASELAQFEGVAGYNDASTENNIGSCSVSYLDSPATTSSTTYKTQLMSNANSASVGVQRNSSVSTITLMEIAA